MRLIFAGTSNFAAASLAALQAAGHQVMLVLTQPDRPAGRGMRLTPSATAQMAGKLGLRVEKPETLNAAATQALIREVAAEVMVVAAYGLLLPQVVLDILPFGCLNIHGSLLPRWRGAAPVQRGIEAGDTETGISIMQMDAGLDTGPVLLKHPLAIAVDETSGSLFAKLTALGANSIVEVLDRLPALAPRPQSTEGVTYAHKIEKSEAHIDWCQPAAVLERRVRAFDPFPGAESVVGGQTIKVWRAEVVSSATVDPLRLPGTAIRVAPGILEVQCGNGALALKTVQKAGGKRLSIGDFLHGTSIQTGAIFT